MREDKELLEIVRQAESEASQMVEDARRKAEERLQNDRREADLLKDKIIAEARREAKGLESSESRRGREALAAVEAEDAEELESMKRRAKERTPLAVERMVEAFWEGLPIVPGICDED